MSSRWYILAVVTLAGLLPVREVVADKAEHRRAPIEATSDEFTPLVLPADVVDDESAAVEDADEPDAREPAADEPGDDRTMPEDEDADTPKEKSPPRRRRRPYDEPPEEESEQQMEQPQTVPSIDGLLEIDQPPGKAPALVSEGPPPRWLDENYVFLNEADPYLPGTDPFREWPDVRVGWFAGLELTAARPSIRSEINSGILGPGDFVSGTFANNFQLPVALEWFAMPKVYVGYRRENGLGEYLLSYRFVQSDSSGTITNFDAAGAGQFSSQLQAHVIDLEYGWTDLDECLPWYLPQMVRRSAGVRFASAVFDSSASGAQILDERAGNVFIGAGPRVNFEGTWPTAVPSLSFVGGADVSGVIGFNYQRFGETALVGGSVVSGSGRTDGRTTATPILRVQGGLSYVPDWRNRTLRFTAGYQWERWWILTDTTSQIDITFQGPFVRGEMRW